MYDFERHDILMRWIGAPGSAGRGIRLTLTQADASPDTVADGGDLAGAIVRGAVSVA